MMSLDSKTVWEAGEMAQKFRTFADFPEDLGSVLSIQTGQLTIFCNSNYSGPETLVWPHRHTYTYTAYMHICTHKQSL